MRLDICSPDSLCRRNDSVQVRDDQGTELDAIADSAVDVRSSKRLF